MWHTCDQSTQTSSWTTPLDYTGNFCNERDPGLCLRCVKPFPALWLMTMTMTMTPLTTEDCSALTNQTENLCTSKTKYWCFPGDFLMIFLKQYSALFQITSSPKKGRPHFQDDLNTCMARLWLETNKVYSQSVVCLLYPGAEQAQRRTQCFHRKLQSVNRRKEK